MQDGPPFSHRPARVCVREEDSEKSPARPGGLPPPGNAAIRGAQDDVDAGSTTSRLTANHRSCVGVSEPDPAEQFRDPAGPPSPGTAPVSSAKDVGPHCGCGVRVRHGYRSENFVNCACILTCPCSAAVRGAQDGVSIADYRSGVGIGEGDAAEPVECPTSS